MSDTLSASVQTDFTLAPEVESYLNGLDCPVRVIDGGYAVVIPEPSDDVITIVSRGGFRGLEGEVTDTQYRCAPAELYIDHTIGRSVGRDWVKPALHDAGTFVEAGDPYAQAGERVVWVFCHLAPADSGGLVWENIDFDKLLGHPIRAAREGIDEARAAIASEQARKLFIDAMRLQGNRRVTSAESVLHDAETNVSHAQRALTQRVQGMRAAATELRIARRSVRTVPDEVLEGQWAAMLAHPKVTKLDAEGENLVIETTGLDLTHPDTDESVYLGRFRITIYPPSNGTIYLRNLDNRKVDADRDHPHVSSGSPCFGGASTLMSTLHGERNYPALLEALIQYLESFNPSDSWGAYGRLWFNGEDDEICDDCHRLYADCNC